MKPLHLVMLCYLVVASSCWPKSKDQVSLQWSICDTNPQAVFAKLGTVIRAPDKLDPITYYDSYPPLYTPKGLMFRTKIRGGQEISVVKVKLPTTKSHVRRHAKSCRWDQYGNETTFTCKRQAPVNGTNPNPKWKELRIEGYKAVLDDVLVQSLHLMELEVKVHRAEEDKVYQSITDHLSARGVVLCARQEPKTMRLFHMMGCITTQNEL